MGDPLLEHGQFPEGSLIFHESEKGNSAYLVQSGKVSIIKNADSENEKVLGTIEKGGIFGEMVLIDDQPRMATARAEEDTIVVVVSRMMFNQKMEKTDPFIRGLLNILANTIRSISKTQ